MVAEKPSVAPESLISYGSATTKRRNLRSASSTLGKSTFTLIVHPHRVDRCSLSSEPVSALALSLTASLLLVGTAPGLVHVYDVRSHQLLRTISVHKGARITHLEALSKPPDLIGHVSLVRATNSEATQPRPIVALQRTRDVASRARRDVSVVLAAGPKVRSLIRSFMSH